MNGPGYKTNQVQLMSHLPIQPILSSQSVQYGSELIFVVDRLG